MKRRQYKKLTNSLVTKIVAKTIQPKAEIVPTKPEKKLFRIKHAYIKNIANIAYRSWEMQQQKE